MGQGSSEEATPAPQERDCPSPLRHGSLRGRLAALDDLAAAAQTELGRSAILKCDMVPIIVQAMRTDFLNAGRVIRNLAAATESDFSSHLREARALRWVLEHWPAANGGAGTAAGAQLVAELYGLLKTPKDVITLWASGDEREEGDLPVHSVHMIPCEATGHTLWFVHAEPAKALLPVAVDVLMYYLPVVPPNGAGYVASATKIKSWVDDHVSPSAGNEITVLLTHGHADGSPSVDFDASAAADALGAEGIAAAAGQLRTLFQQDPSRASKYTVKVHSAPLVRGAPRQLLQAMQAPQGSVECRHRAVNGGGPNPSRGCPITELACRQLGTAIGAGRVEAVSFRRMKLRDRHVLAMIGALLSANGVHRKRPSGERRDAALCLSFAENLLTAWCVPAVAIMLKLLSCLQCLDLSFNTLGPGGADCVGFGAPKLEVLKMAFCSLQGDGATRLTKHLSGNGRHFAPCLRDMWLEGNSIGDTGAKALAGLLRTGLCSLQLLSISDNEVGDDGGVEIFRAIGCGSSKLFFLFLSHNSLGAASAAAIKEVLCTQRDGPLTSLELGYNSFDDDAVGVLAKGAFENKSLRYMGLKQSKVTAKGEKVIEQIQTIASSRTLWTSDSPHHGKYRGSAATPPQQIFYLDKQDIASVVPNPKPSETQDEWGKTLALASEGE